MTKNQKTFAYVGGGILLLLLLFRKKAQAKSLEEGAPTEDGSGGGGGFGSGSGGGVPVIAPLVVPTPVVAPNWLQQNVTPPKGYVIVGQNGLLAPLSGLNPNNPSQAVVPISTIAPQRATPTPTPTTTTTASTQAIQLPQPTLASATSKFADFDGDANFQDQLL